LWAGTPEHVTAVQSTYGEVEEVWSADWMLRHSSPSASAWSGPLTDLTRARQFLEDPRDARWREMQKIEEGPAYRDMQRTGGDAEA
jgi:hypothetical protein